MAKKKTKIYTSSEQAFKDIVKKRQSKLYKLQAQQKFDRLQRSQLQQVGYQQSQALKRQRIMNILGSKAEQLEIEAVSLNETPYLFNVEKQRMRACTPPDKYIQDTENSVAKSFPD